jgi:hypothetical protein
MTTFPVELLDYIFSFSSRNDLPIVACVGSALYHVAVPLIYATLVDLPIRNNILALRTIDSKPELAIFVRKYALNLPSGSEYRVLLSTAHLMERCLRNMKNLSDIAFDCRTIGSRLTLDAVALNTRIHTLSFSVIVEPPKTPFDVLLRKMSFMPVLPHLHFTFRLKNWGTGEVSSSHLFGI